MTRRLTGIALAVLLAALAAHGWASAQDQTRPGPHPGPRSGAGPHFGEGRHFGPGAEFDQHRQGLQQWLGLTDDQMTQIRALRQRHMESRRQIATALQQAQMDLRRLALGGGTPDAMQAKQAEVQQLLGQMVELRVKHLQEIAPLLTPEQREKLAQRGPGRHRHGPRQQT